MKLNKNFLTHSIAGQTVLIPVAEAEFHGLVQGNKSVDVIFQCLQNDTTEEEIVEEMCRRYDGDREVIRADVADTIRKLKSIGAIDE
ncbi:MAG: PqqD family protein [Ruminococcus sp.]|nr:PqqD family protein [Ruminococcus sp.]